MGDEPIAVEHLWYRGARVGCTRFGAPLALDQDRVPTSPIYVTFVAGTRYATRAASSLAVTHSKW